MELVPVAELAVTEEAPWELVPAAELARRELPELAEEPPASESSVAEESPPVMEETSLQPERPRSEKVARAAVARTSARGERRGVRAGSFMGTSVVAVAPAAWVLRSG